MTQNLGVVADVGGALRLEGLPEPSPTAGEAVVATRLGGICGSDLHYWQHGAAGESILRRAMVLGHEVVGSVSIAAADGSGPPVGARVAVHPATAGTPTFRYPAERPNLSGGTYLGSAARDPHTPGAFARRVALPTRMLRELPDDLTFERAALAEPASVAWHAANRAGDLRGKRILVVGSGPIGALIVAVAARAGAREIVATDVFEEPLQRAIALGATSTALARDSDVIAAVDADLVFESSGSARGLASAIAGATRGGRVVMVGLLPTGLQPAPLSLAITRELELVGSFRFNDEFDDVVSALADGSLAVDPVVSHTFPVDDALEAFTVALDASRSGKVLLDFGEPGPEVKLESE